MISIIAIILFSFLLPHYYHSTSLLATPLPFPFPSFPSFSYPEPSFTPSRTSRKPLRLISFHFTSFRFTSLRFVSSLFHA
ncbi:hypothetical protein GGR53DRAFT_476227 [Hypoxylon sp. FL1150]|nr:hypothetical protein GGR53DRAFT_476227 [Hypoxylon sp. FL1150]